MNALAAALSEPVPAALPVSADPNLLRDLFFGDYEPEISKVSPELQRVGQTVSQDDKALTATLSEESMKLRCRSEISLRQNRRMRPVSAPLCDLPRTMGSIVSRYPEK